MDGKILLPPNSVSERLCSCIHHLDQPQLQSHQRFLLNQDKCFQKCSRLVAICVCVPPAFLPDSVKALLFVMMECDSFAGKVGGELMFHFTCIYFCSKHSCWELWGFHLHGGERSWNTRRCAGQQTFSASLWEKFIHLC